MVLVIERLCTSHITVCAAVHILPMATSDRLQLPEFLKLTPLLVTYRKT